jgi:hypothetical protein
MLTSPGLESREYGCRDPSRWPHDTLYLQKLALTSPTSGGLSVGIVCSYVDKYKIKFKLVTIYWTNEILQSIVSSGCH